MHAESKAVLALSSVFSWAVQRSRAFCQPRSEAAAEFESRWNKQVRVLVARGVYSLGTML